MTASLERCMPVRRHCGSTVSFLSWRHRCESVVEIYFQLSLSSGRGQKKMFPGNSIDISGTAFLLQGSKYITRVHSHISNSSSIICILKYICIYISCILRELAVIGACLVVVKISWQRGPKASNQNSSNTHCCLQGMSDYGGRDAGAEESAASCTVPALLRNVLSWSLPMYRHKLSCPNRAKTFISSKTKIPKKKQRYHFVCSFLFFFSSQAPLKEVDRMDSLHHTHSCPHPFSHLLFLLKYTYSISNEK